MTLGVGPLGWQDKGTTFPTTKTKQNNNYNKTSFSLVMQRMRKLIFLFITLLFSSHLR